MKTISVLFGSLLLFACTSQKAPVKGNTPLPPASSAASEDGNTPQRLVGNDRDEHGCIHSAGYQWSEIWKDCIRLWEKGIATEAMDGSGHSVFIVFGPDSAQAELFFSDGRPTEILERRTLPTGRYVWNVEDDDTKNVRQTDGLWTISQRNKLIYSQRPDGLGAMQQHTYEGLLPAASCPGIVYSLSIRNWEHSGDGTFLLSLTYKEAENGKDQTVTYEGKRYTLRGMPGNDNATVWQLVPDNEKQIFYFLVEDGQTLTLLDNKMERIQSKLNYSLKLVE